MSIKTLLGCHNYFSSLTAYLKHKALDMIELCLTLEIITVYKLKKGPSLRFCSIQSKACSFHYRRKFEPKIRWQNKVWIHFFSISINFYPFIVRKCASLIVVLHVRCHNAWERIWNCASCHLGTWLFRKLWACFPNCMLMIVFVAILRFPKLFGPGRKRLI